MVRCPIHSLLTALTLLVTSSVFAQSAPNPDFFHGAVIGAFHEHDPLMMHFSLVYRGQASDDLDIMLVRGGRFERRGLPPSGFVYLNQGDLLGLFLVDRSDPALLYELIIDNDVNDKYEAYVEVERALPGELTIFVRGNYSIPTTRTKCAYDARSRRLLWRRDFSPHGMEHVSESDDTVTASGRIGQPGTPRWYSPLMTVTVNLDTDFYPLTSSAQRPDDTSVSFGPDDQCSVTSASDLGPAAARFVVCSSVDGPQLFHAPQTDFARFAEARPAKVSYVWTEEHATFDEPIGPYPVDGSVLWFGLTFYDGEGTTGVGGVGFFDTATRDFEMYYPPEIANWPTSALLVEPDALWLGLEGRGEGASNSGGLLRWDRATQETQRWPDTPLIHGLARQGNRLYLATGEGAAIFEDGKFIRYVLDVDEQGEYALALRELR